MAPTPIIDPTQNVLQLVEAAVKRLDDIAALRAEHAKELRQAEARRLDAVRNVDMAQVTSSAELLRNLVATTAEVSNSRITVLERANYEGKGRSALSIPILLVATSAITGMIVFIIQKLLT